MLRFLDRALEPAGFHGGADASAWRDAKRVVGVATAIKLVLAAIVPVFPDEAYYWEWSRRLAAGYFDHPPVIAWLVKLGTLVAGNTSLGVRVMPILCGAACTLAVASIARSLSGDAAARLAALVFSVMPIVAVGSILATPDLPMLCGVAWALYATMRALGLPANGAVDREATPRDQLKWWVVAGVAIGLAMESKFTSVFVPAGIALAFVMHGRLQNRLGQLGPYTAVIVASVIMVPVLWWNADNDWIAFRFQLSHGLGAPKGGAMGGVNRELELLGGQVGLVSPILFYFVVRALRDAVRFSEEGFRLVLGVASLAPIAFFIYSATRKSVEANWPAIAWIGAVALLASDPPHSARARAWLRRGIILAAALSAIVYVHVVVPILPLPAPRDQVAKAFGWDLVAATVERKREALRLGVGRGRGAPVPDNAYIGAERYQEASELAFHLADHPRVFALNLTGRANQYDLWKQFKDEAPLGSTLILVLDDQRGEPRVIRKLSCCFQRIDESEGVSLMRGNALIERKRIWILSGKNDGWPARDEPFPPPPAPTVPIIP